MVRYPAEHAILQFGDLEPGDFFLLHNSMSKDNTLYLKIIPSTYRANEPKVNALRFETMELVEIESRQYVKQLNCVVKDVE